MRCKALNARGAPCDTDPALVDQETGLCDSHSEGGREEMARRGKGTSAALPHCLTGLDETPPWIRSEL